MSKVPPSPLSSGEDLVLQVFKLRHIRPGYGLYYDVLLIELKDHPTPIIFSTVSSLVEKGYLQAHPFLTDFFILTKEGFNYLSPTP